YGFITLLALECIAVITGIVMRFPTAETFEEEDIVKHIARYVRGRWNGVRIVQLMLRDGTIAFCALIAATTCLLIYVVLDLPYAGTCYANWLDDLRHWTRTHECIDRTRPLLRSNTSSLKHDFYFGSSRTL
ncbi:hypothetical protein MPER_08941, partial [Moniliophthora perniciosa FA553]